MRISRRTAVTFVFVVLVAVAALALTRLRGPHAQAVVDSHTAAILSSPQPDGCRAAFELVQAMGRHPHVVHAPWSKLTQSAVPLAVLYMPARIAGERGMGQVGKARATRLAAKKLRAWVGQGHTLIWVASQAYDDPRAQSDTEPKDAVMSTEQAFIGAAQGTTAVEATPALPCLYTDGVVTVRCQAAFAGPLPGALPLLTSPRGAAATVYPEGTGRVVALADATVIQNHGIGRSDNARFLWNLVAASTKRGDTVWFYVPDVSADILSTPLSLHLAPEMLRAILQALAAMGVFALAAFSRFGTARDASTVTERSTAEYLTSMSSLFRRARATGPAYAIVFSRFCKDTKQRLVLDPTTSLADLAKAVARTTGRSAVDVEAFFTRSQATAAQHKLVERDVVALAMELETLRKEMEIV